MKDAHFGLRGVELSNGADSPVIDGMIGKRWEEARSECMGPYSTAVAPVTLQLLAKKLREQRPWEVE